MVYSRKGPGPLRGLPSLLLSDAELKGMEDLKRFDAAIKKFNLTPPKKIVAVTCTHNGDTADLTLKLRGLKSRGFMIYAITGDASASWLSLVDGVIARVTGGEPWIGFRALAFVQVVDSAEDLVQREFFPEIAGIPKYLDVVTDRELDSALIGFLHKSEYAWIVQHQTWGAEASA